MRTKKQESAEQASIEAWNRIWNEVLKNIMCDQMAFGGPSKLTEEDEMLLYLIHERRLPAAIAARVAARV